MLELFNMNFFSVASLDGRKKSQLLVLPFWKGKTGAVPAAATLNKLKSLFHDPITLEDFKGSEGEVLFVYGNAKFENRIVLLGLGEQEKATIEQLRRAYSNLTKACHAKKIKDINLLLPHIPALTEEGIV